MKKKVSVTLLISFLLLSLCGGTTALAAPAAEETVLATGWFRQGGDYYYRNKRGRVLKNCRYKIDGSYYRFDSKGRRVTGKRKTGNGFTEVYNKKTGKFQSCYITLKVKKVDKTGFTAVTTEKPANKLRINMKGVKMENVFMNNWALQGEIRKGSIVKVYTSICPTIIIGKGGHLSGVKKVRLIENTDGLDIQDQYDMMIPETGTI